MMGVYEFGNPDSQGYGKVNDNRCAEIMRLLAPVLVLVCVTASLGQTLESRGRAWLDARPAPAQINVNGEWYADHWGTVTLSQAQDSRNVTGKADGWDIVGVVSGTKLCLLFCERGRVIYSAELSPVGPSSFSGTYADGLLSPRSKTRLIHFSKKE
jgi:hypothetical protein